MSAAGDGVFATRWLGLRTLLAMTYRGSAGGAGAYSGLNLATHVGDDPAHVRANRAALAAELEVSTRQVLFLDQVHGADVVVAREPWSTPPRADAAVTATPGLYLAVLVADCVPVILADDAAGVVGVAHAGRLGVRSAVVPAAVAAMRALGAAKIRAVVGPSICAGCYEVPDQMRAEVSASEPRTWSRSRSGTPSLDLRAGVAAQLSREEISPQMSAVCTGEDARFFSYRRDNGRTGRCAGIAGVRPAQPPESPAQPPPSPTARP